MASTRFALAVRQFSTSASRSKLVQAPIQLFGLEGRYAHALYSAASKESKLDAVEKDVKTVQELFKTSTKLADHVNDPSLKKNDKKDVLGKILAEQKCTNITVNLFSLLAENGRLNKMDSILNAFNKIMSAHRGEIVCTVTTAKPLDASNMKELKTALQGFLKKGEVLQLDTKVDPSIIGGMIVDIGDKYIDMSMATKIRTYTKLLKEAV